MKVYLIDNYDSFTWNLVQLLEQNGAQEIKVVKNDQVNIDDMKEYDKMLISPGPGLPDEIPVLIKLIKYFAGRKSMLGVCLGHQAIAIAFGGRLIQLDRILHGDVSDILITEHEEYLFRDVPSSFKGGRYHSWMVDNDSLPSQLQVIARDADGNIMALRHRIHDIHGVQFHPESFMTPWGGRIIKNWLDH